MSDLPVKGDRAIIVKHCCSDSLYGGVVTVGDDATYDPAYALLCAREAKGLSLVVIESNEHKFHGLDRPMIFPRKWLKKLPPLEEPEQDKEETDEPIFAGTPT